MSLRDRTIPVVGMKCFGISAIALALMTAPVWAQVVRLKCDFGNNNYKLITIDYSAKKFTYEFMDAAGNIDPEAGGANDGLADLPATITSESISARSQRQCGVFTAVLNRRSGILGTTFCSAPSYSKPCVPYTVGPQRF
jgi:hypothetical protein